MKNPLPQDGPLFAFYGDDFTGSTDALESLAVSGVRTVLFTNPPDTAQLRAFAGYRGIGVAGDSRSRTPREMQQALPGAFECLRKTGAPVVQYKVCSTFDSSPSTGSIGTAIEIGRRVFGQATVPVVAAAPILGRYVAFGNLFAAEHASDQSPISRIDRHTTMSRHPVTPMDEADLRIHLSRQTALAIGGFDLRSMYAPDAIERLSKLECDAVVFDGLTEDDQALSAEAIWRTHQAPFFAVGSSGFTYGMLQYWQRQNWIPEALALPRAAPTERLLALAGSCSPVTGRQIWWALRHGFAGIRHDPSAPLNGKTAGRAAELLGQGRSVILYTALGPEDFRECENREVLAASMGELLRDVAVRTGVRRVAVGGGDTASHAIRKTGIRALTYSAPLAPGAPLCRAHGGELNGLEIVLKGGQVGRESFFGDALQGDAT